MPHTNSPKLHLADHIDPPLWGWLCGLLLCLIGLASSAALAVSHVLAAHLPGCGPGSPCAQASASFWGKVPVIAWPTAFLAAAYFGAVTVGWLCSRFGLSRGARVALVVGGVGSILFLAVSVKDGLYCPYCLAANLANLAILVLAFTAMAPRSRSGAGAWGVPAGVMVFIAATGVLGVAEAVSKEQARREAEKRLAEDTAKMIQKPASTAPTTPTQTPTPPPPSAPTPANANKPVNQVPAPPSNAPAPIAAPAIWPTGLTGRYRRGPEVAPVRIVMLTDYQCPDCKRIETDVREMMQKNPQVSVAIKYFPFSTDCNPAVGRNLHGNACWAARAAETAGVLDGTDGFWRMHQWLFDRGGAFTNTELRAALPGLGFDPDSFDTVMQSPETLNRVKADIADGYALGLFYTPMIFINGVELRGWNAPQSVSRAVASVLATNPAPASADLDRPPLAMGKAIDDWRQSPSSVQADPQRPALGDAAAKVSVVVYGDYLEPGTFDADGVIRGLIKAGSPIRYEFRPFPMDKACNTKIPQTLFPGACLAARAVEAARLAGGSDGAQKFWAMHEWLMNNRTRLSEQAITDGAPALGLEAQSLSIAMDVPQVQKRVTDDVDAALRVGVTGLPAIFVNGKLVARWKIANQVVLGRIIEEASK